MLAGVWAARTRNERTGRRLAWVATAAGAWLAAASCLLASPAKSAGVWNDAIVGAAVVVLGAWRVKATGG